MLIPNKLKVTYTAVMPDGKRFTEVAESNAVGTEILSYSVTATLTVDKASVREGETVRYTATVTNSSAAQLFDTFFSAPRPDGALFVAGSVKINGAAQPLLDPVQGFSLPDLAPDGVVVIEYDFKIISRYAPVTHFAKLDYVVTDPERGDVNFTNNTNAVIVRIMRYIYYCCWCDC